MCRLAFVPGRPAGPWLCSAVEQSLWLGSQPGAASSHWVGLRLCSAFGWGSLSGCGLRLCAAFGQGCRLGSAAAWVTHCAGSLAARGCAPSWDRCWLGALPARGCPSRPGFLDGWDWRLCLAVEQGRGCALLPGGAIERAHSWRRPLPGDLAQALRWADPDWDLYLCAAAGRSAVHQDLSAAKYMIV